MKNTNNTYQYIFEKSKPCNTFSKDNIQITSIHTPQDFKSYYHIPFHIYRNNSYWVPPFWKEFSQFFKTKNPFWSHADCQLFIAHKNHKPVGCSTAIIDHNLCKKIRKNIGYFGFFECTNNYTLAKHLLNCVKAWLQEKNMTVMRGPIDGRVDVRCGFLLNGYNTRPYFFSSYSPPYYISFTKKYGMKKARDQLYYLIDLTKPIPSILKKKANESLNMGMSIRKFNRLRSQHELKWWVNLFLETFADHWGYVPVSPEEVRARFGIKQIRWFVDSALFLIAEKKETPIAFIWSMPDYNQIFQKMKGKLGPFQLLYFLLTKRTINKGKMPLIGIKKEYRDKHLGSLLNYHTLHEMKHRGYTSAEVGWIDEKNAIAHSTISLTGAQLYKKTRVFDINI